MFAGNKHGGCLEGNIKHQAFHRVQNTYFLLGQTAALSSKCNENTQNFQMESHCQEGKRKYSKDCGMLNNKACNKTYEKKTWMSSLEREYKKLPAEIFKHYLKQEAGGGQEVSK